MATRTKKEIPDPTQLLAMRERQSWAASMINFHFGAFKDSKPELWTHRTFMLIVAKVYEHLVLCEAISPKEFLELARTLGESNKSTPTGKDLHGAKESGSADSNLGGVVAGLEEMVRQIYGTNLQMEEPKALSPATATAPPMNSET